MSECFSLEVLEKILKEIKQIFGKDIYIPKDSISLKEEIEIYREPKNVYQKLVSILDNITGIKKISEIGWVY